jgi:hypothetical protein
MKRIQAKPFSDLSGAARKFHSASYYESYQNEHTDLMPGTHEWFPQHEKYHYQGQAWRAPLLRTAADPGFSKSALTIPLVSERNGNESQAISTIASATHLTRGILSTVSGIAGAPQSLQRLEHELHELDTIFAQMNQTHIIDFLCASSESSLTQGALQTYFGELTQIQYLIRPIESAKNSSMIQKSWNDLRAYLKEDDIKSIVSKLQLRKLTLCLAIISNFSRFVA